MQTVLHTCCTQILPYFDLSSWGMCSSLCHCLGAASSNALTPWISMTGAGKHSCLCGHETAEVACQDLPFQCGQVCGRQLDCGRHTCQEVCHKGDCGLCPLQGPRSCPCGKVSIKYTCFSTQLFYSAEDTSALQKFLYTIHAE